MNSSEQEPIKLAVLRVASPGVLGRTQPLSVATPFCSSNAKGHLKSVDNFKDIASIAAESANNFKASIKAKY